MSESPINLVNIKDTHTSYLCYCNYSTFQVLQSCEEKLRVKYFRKYLMCCKWYTLLSCWLGVLFLYFLKLIYEVNFVLTLYVWKPRSEAIKVIRTHCFLNQNTWYIHIMWYSNSEKILKIMYGIHCLHQSPIHTLFLPQEGMTSRIWHVWHCAKDKSWMPLILLLFN